MPEAAVSFDRTIAIRVGDATAYRERGDTLLQLGRFEEALDNYNRALELAPELGLAHYNRGAALAALNRHQEALAGFDRVISLGLARAGGNAGAKTGAPALASLSTLAAADHLIAEAFYSRGTLLIRLERYEEARGSFDKALALYPGYAEAFSNRGVAHAELGSYDDALSDYEMALRFAPDFADAHNNRGNAFLALNRLDEALRCYAEAIAHAPDHADANFNAAVTRLCMGDFHLGWKQYEARWTRKKNPVPRPNFRQAMWRGEKALHGKTILLCAEQGIGDAIQFVRYAPMVAALGAKVLLLVHPVLTGLMATVPGIAQVLGEGEALPDFDLYCPLLSLPAAFDTELATIPAGVPYIRPYGAYLDKWRDRLPANGRLRVGLCWAGSGAHVNNRRRSLSLQHFGKILAVPGVDFISLQKEVSPEHDAILRDKGVIQLAQGFQDFADTAAVVALLDLIISVDTSVAHLAGAMGKATAVLLPFAPDFRWQLDRTDCPWYPTLRLFRQPAIGDWEAPLERLRQELLGVARRRAQIG